MERRAPPEPSSACRIPAGNAFLDADLEVPARAHGLVVFAHGSGSGRHSPRNQAVARTLVRDGLATLLLDLLTPGEEAVDARTRHLRFDIGLLAERLEHAVRWAATQPALRPLAVGFFGASTGAGAALVAAARLASGVGAVVSRGGRPDLAADALGRVRCPTLLLVGGLDGPVIDLNEEAYARLTCPKRLQVIPGASHLFEEPGTLEEVARRAAAWFLAHLGRREPVA
jgi:dienelactone hydrolase